MYCVKCGRQGGASEKRCPDCGTRLVTPAKLKSLLELEKYTNSTFTGKLKLTSKRVNRRLRKRSKKLGRAIGRFFARAGSALGTFFSKLSVDMAALFALLRRLIKALAKAFWKGARVSARFIAKYAAIGAKRFVRYAKAKSAELKRQYQQEKASRSNIQYERARPADKRGKKPGEAKTRASSQKTQTLRAAGARNEKNTAWWSVREAPARAKNEKGVIRPDRGRLTGSDAQRLKANTQKAAGSKRGAAPAYGADRARQAAQSKRRKKPRPFTRPWAEEHMRSLVAMGLLAAALLIFLFWGEFSDSGQKTFAQIGLGSAHGYMLIGDDYMAQQNYGRAVEYYYSSISKDLSYEAALKLAIAYSYTGDISKEVSALLLCTENYPENELPFRQLYSLYPEGSQRPARVLEAIEKGQRLYGNLG